MAKNTEQFTAQILVKTVVDVTLKATTLEAAVEVAKSLAPRDLLAVKPGVSFNDYEVKVVGINSSEWL